MNGDDPRTTRHTFTSRYAEQRSVADARAAVCRANSYSREARSIITVQAIAACAHAGLSPRQTSQALGIAQFRVGWHWVQATASQSIQFPQLAPTAARVAQEIQCAWL